MKSSLAYRIRFLLVRFAKSFPFVLCFIVFLYYAECLLSLSTHCYAIMDCGITLDTPINWFIAKQFEYGIWAISIAVILSFAMETCIYNKLAILYLLINLVEKHYFSTIELCEETIYAIVVVNLLVSGFFVWKGVTILIKK